MAATTDSFLDLLRPQHVHDNVDAWRWTVRRRLVPVRDLLVAEPLHRRDAWLSARAACVVRERDALLERLHDLSHQVLVATDVDGWPPSSAGSWSTSSTTGSASTTSPTTTSSSRSAGRSSGSRTTGTP